MTSWILINCLLSIIAAALITVNLVMYSEKLGCPQRIGMSFIAAALVLNIGPILAREGSPFGTIPATPFDDWATTLLRVGLVIHFGARIVVHAVNAGKR